MIRIMGEHLKYLEMRKNNAIITDLSSNSSYNLFQKITLFLYKISLKILQKILPKSQINYFQKLFS